MIIYFIASILRKGQEIRYPSKNKPIKKKSYIPSDWFVQRDFIMGFNISLPLEYTIKV